MQIIQLIMVLFLDYLPAIRIQQDVLTSEPLPGKKKEKSKEKDQTHACPNVRKKRRASYDTTGMRY